MARKAKTDFDKLISEIIGAEDFQDMEDSESLDSDIMEEDAESGCSSLESVEETYEYPCIDEDEIIKNTNQIVLDNINEFKFQAGQTITITDGKVYLQKDHDEPLHDDRNKSESSMLERLSITKAQFNNNDTSDILKPKPIKKQNRKCENW